MERFKSLLGLRSEKNINIEKKLFDIPKLLNNYKIKELTTINDTDEIVYRSEGQNPHKKINETSLTQLNNFGNNVFKDKINRYIQYDYSNINIEHIINIYNINFIKNLLSKDFKNNKNNKIVLLKIGKYTRCNLYLKFVKGKLIRSIYSNTDNLLIKNTKLLKNQLLIYEFIFIESSLIICLDIDEQTSKILYEDILDENGIIDVKLVYINFLLLILFSFYINKFFSSNIFIDTDVNDELLTFNSIETIDKIKRNIESEIIISNDINYKIIKTAYQNHIESKTNKYNLKSLITNDSSKSDKIEITKTLLEDTDLNFCKFSIIFEDLHNFYIHYYALKYPIRCLCNNNISEKQQRYYKLCITIKYNLYDKKISENISIYFKDKEQYELYLKAIENQEQYQDIIKELQYIFCLVKYVYMQEYLINEYQPELIGGKLKTNRKKYQLYICDNNYYVNYNRKRFYLSKKNTYKKNNSLFIKINKDLELKIKI